MQETATRRPPWFIAVAFALAAWLVYWSWAVRGDRAALALLVALVLVAFVANLRAPVAWARPWNNAQAWGAASIFAGGTLLAAARAWRSEGVDLPYMDPEQLTPYAWLVSAVCFLMGAWFLLGGNPTDEDPTCAQCGAPARGDRCARCGSAFAV